MILIAEESKNSLIILITVAIVGIVGIVGIVISTFGIIRTNSNNERNSMIPLQEFDVDEGGDMVGLAHAAVPNDSKLGDVNNDGLITPKDASLVFNYFLGKVRFTNEQKKRADVNKDDQITPADALCIHKKILNQPSCLDKPQEFCNENSLIGDVNGDGIITPGDAQLIFKVGFNQIPKPSNICCIDVDKNQQVTMEDVQMMYNHLLQNGKPTGFIGQRCS